MENVLNLYEQTYNPEYPVICFDERPCQLIEDVLTPVPVEPGKARREDYHYKRNGTCNVLMAIEPLAGTRVAEVTVQRTKKEYADFFKSLESHYSDAKKIIVIQDNLNTHTPSSFYENLPIEEAFFLMNRFQMVYTPKKASWLNMAEIEFSALSKQCLDRRIGDLMTLAFEVETWVKKRNSNKTKIHWQFTNDKARDKFSRHYNMCKN